MKQVGRFALLVAMLAILISGLPKTGSSVYAWSNQCRCWSDTYIDAYTYSSGFVASYGPWDVDLGAMPGTVPCANACQSWINSFGSSVCTGAGIEDTGYVVEHWRWWWFGGDPPSSGHLDQQFDCNDI